MSKHKRKRKNDEPDLYEQLENCGVVVIRLIAGLVMLILIGAMLVLVYLKFLFPGFEISVWLAMSGLFSYLSGYLAFEWSGNGEEEEKRKNDWQDDDFHDEFDEDN